LFELTLDGLKEIYLTFFGGGQIRCAATGGYPPPQLSWSEPADSEVDFTAEPEIVTLTKGHTINVYHTIQVRI